MHNQPLYNTQPLIRQRKHQSSASLAFVRGIRRWPVNSPHKGPVTRKIFPFDDVTMICHEMCCALLTWYYINVKDPCGVFIHIFKSSLAWMNSYQRLNAEKLRKHDDIIKWKHFSSYWPFVWGESTDDRWIPLRKGHWSGTLGVFFDLRLNNRLSKQSRRWWFETPSLPLLRHCNDMQDTTRNDLNTPVQENENTIFSCFLNKIQRYKG